jgi:hypothetical protein
MKTGLNGKLAVIVAAVLALVLIGVSGVTSCAVITGDTQSIPAETIEVNTLNIPVKMYLSDISPRTTEITVLSVVKDTVKVPMLNYLIMIGKSNFVKGDPCITITAEFTNTTNITTEALIAADGYDINHQQKSWVIDVPGSVPFTNVAYRHIPALSKTTVTVTANWADNLEEMDLNVRILLPSDVYPELATPSTVLCPQR